MPFPVALAVCENDLRRDLTFLKEFAGSQVDLRVTPLGGGTLDDGVVRLLARQVDSFSEADLTVQAIVVHHDADRTSHRGRVKAVTGWFERSSLREKGAKLVACVPAPCIERWLCIGEGLSARSANPAVGCEPWKKAWSGRKGIDLDRVRDVARSARTTLTTLPDFAAFLDAWRAAGLP